MPLQQAQAQPPTRSTGPCSSIDFYWKHVCYPGRLSEIKNCITVTGKVYSSSGTKEDPDGDLHFTLQLDPQFANKGYSIPNECNPAAKDCTNIIVEVICHSTPSSDYKTKWGDYCKSVQSKILPISNLRKVNIYLLAANLSWTKIISGTKFITLRMFKRFHKGHKRIVGSKQLSICTYSIFHIQRTMLISL
jgi:hypothetical protein